ncbi:coiled-coil domain-containing protein 178 isoform X2 [Betta splendens]|uniref:Coiled-coil domain-containing protein 178 isoform X2 n=1 Tax=Betta splendens TaxID=158456 RepID=A0A9W2XEH3_BETSP|nr:coiled-coil domain-containing protein 178 isoform X2 [Betta splendens]
MPDVEPIRHPSRERPPSQQAPTDLQLGGALLNSPSPCVNNAMYHIREMKRTVEIWCQQYGKYHPLFNPDKKDSRTFRFQSRDSDTESVTSSELFVEGIAISARENCSSSPLLKKINDVLGEAVYLIERLEGDRQYAKEALHKEKQRKRLLESQMDNICLWKQQEHAFAVQKEHEACSRDIMELKWQLKFRREKLDNVQEKLTHTEVLNQHLHEDIDFAIKQTPIVRENLDVQRGIINEINIAQKEADDVYSKTQSRLIMVQKELEKLELDASKERMSQDCELVAIKNQLENKLKEFNQLTMADKHIRVEIEDTEKTAADTSQKCTATKQRILEMTGLEKTEKDLILQLTYKIEEEVPQNNDLEKQLMALQEHYERTKHNGEAKVSCTEERLQSKRNAFAAVLKENMEYEQNIEDYKTKISKSEKAVEHLCDEREQMLQEITDNEEQWEKAKKELTQVIAQHSVTRRKLEEQEQLTFMEEQRARKEMENLTNGLTDQKTALERLKGQCANIKEELKHQKRNSAQTYDTLQKEFKDSSSATKALEAKVENIKKLLANLEAIECKHKKILINLETEKRLKCDHLKAAQDSYTATVERYDRTLDRISDLTKKTEQYKDASSQLEKNIERMTDVIAELESELDVVHFKNKSAALIMSTLQSDINNCQQRTQRSMQTHTALVKARKKEMEETKEALKNALEENKRLSAEYEDLQMVLMEARQEAVTALSRKNNKHSSLHRYTQLSLLQKRMHKALEKYFKQRSLYSQAELDRCQALSQETNQKIKTAQDKLLGEIQRISVFLQSSTDDARVKTQANPDETGDVAMLI